MLNETWDAETALSTGLVSRLIDDEALLAEARTLAAQLAAGPTRTFGEMKRLLLSTTDQPLETQMELEAQAIARCARTADSWNAIQALMQRQEPVFEGR